MTRSCLHCGTPFPVDETDGRSRRRKFCSERCRKRRCDESHRTACIDCGKTLAPASGWKRNTTRCCSDCLQARETARIAERGHLIEELWAEGVSSREIATRLGWAPNQAGRYLSDFRDRGFDLPYRYRLDQAKHPALKRAA